MSLRGLVFALLLAGLVGCRSRERHFESVCQIISRDIVAEDDKGKPEQISLELEWDPCPGDQFQVIRGGAEFAACTERYQVGELVSVGVVQRWDPHGFYTWAIERVGECRRNPDEGDEGSYEKSQECTDAKLQGAVYGFTCSRKPTGELARVCPWMRRD